MPLLKAVFLLQNLLTQFGQPFDFLHERFMPGKAVSIGNLQINLVQPLVLEDVGPQARIHALKHLP